MQHLRAINWNKFFKQPSWHSKWTNIRVKYSRNLFNLILIIISSSFLAASPRKLDEASINDNNDDKRRYGTSTSFSYLSLPIKSISKTDFYFIIWHLSFLYNMKRCGFDWHTLWRLVCGQWFWSLNLEITYAYPIHMIHMT